MLTLPNELWLITLEHVNSITDLRSCSLTSQAIVQPSQRRLFHHLTLGSQKDLFYRDPDADAVTEKTLTSLLFTLQSSPHLGGYVRSLILGAAALRRTALLLQILPFLSCVTTFRIYFREEAENANEIIPPYVLDALKKFILPNVNHMSLYNFGNPSLRLSLRCFPRTLRSLEVQDMTFHEDKAELSHDAFEQLTHLSVFNMRSSYHKDDFPLADGLLAAKAPIRYMKFRCWYGLDGGFSAKHFYVRLLQPFHDTLVCIDLGDLCDQLWHTGSNFDLLNDDTFLERFPKLRCIQLSMLEGADSSRLDPSLSWITRIISGISQPHQLEYICFDVSDYGDLAPWSPQPQVSKICGHGIAFDKALRKNSANLPSFRMVHVPMYSMYEEVSMEAYRELVRDAFPISDAEGRLSMGHMDVFRFYEGL